MVISRREKLREETLTEIKNIAWQQIATHGAGQLSLRGIAAEMGMTAPGLYRYFKDRDHLVTALIVDAFNFLGDTLEAVSKSLPAAKFGERFLAVTMAFRDWALTNREKFILVYGSPIPGYTAPPKVTTPPAIRATVQFITLIEEAWQAGAIIVPAEYTALNSPTHTQLADWYSKFGVTMPIPVLHILMAGWGQIHGLVSLELYGHLNYFEGDVGELYRAETVAYLNRLGLLPEK